MPATDILGKIGEKVGTEFSNLKVSLGNIYSTQVSLGNLASIVSTNTGNISTNTNNITNLQNASSIYATKVSLGQTRTSIANILNGSTVFSDLSATRAEIGDLTVTGTTTTLGSDNYSEITYDSSGNVSSISTWVDSNKTTLIEVKTLTYTSGSLTGIVVTDGNGNTQLTQTLAYDASGNLESIEKDYA